MHRVNIRYLIIRSGLLSMEGLDKLLRYLDHSGMKDTKLRELVESVWRKIGLECLELMRKNNHHE